MGILKQVGSTSELRVTQGVSRKQPTARVTDLCRLLFLETQLEGRRLWEKEGLERMLG